MGNENKKKASRDGTVRRSTTSGQSPSRDLYAREGVDGALTENPCAPGDAARAAGATDRDRQMFEDICGDLNLRIASDGTWYYHGSPIGRKPLVKLFASVLRRDDEGVYWLVTPAEKGRIEVEDVPFVAVELTVAGEGSAQEITLRTNLDEIVTVGDDHPLRVDHDPDSGEPRPYVLVRDRLEARLLRPVFYDLVALGEEHETDGERKLGVWSGGRFFVLGALDREGA